MNGNELNERAENEFLDQAFSALYSESGIVVRASATALRKYAYQRPEQAKKLDKMLKSLADSDKMEIVALVEEIKFEVESLR